MRNADAKVQEKTSSEDDSLSQRVADGLQERIDRAAGKGKEIERSLVAGSTRVRHKALELGADAQGKAQQLNHGFVRLARDKPWTVVGGAVALGILIGAFSNRR
ncbi:DUF883 family protein [Azoarcus sp. L1K30]|uniref:glycine zipper domain-containing protein n=1 Tax=Azoarcus sp. L1K30 TaxID=2820277 RepID=UPI001B836ADB|nr:DUF883 family protein [Azoarcus sp. L1K30]MBR0566882.1 DUF883 family protein [Azoarcus sp. L1K30]